jgi:hypothetical protein
MRTSLSSPCRFLSNQIQHGVATVSAAEEERIQLMKILQQQTLSQSHPHKSSSIVELEKQRRKEFSQKIESLKASYQEKSIALEAEVNVKKLELQKLETDEGQDWDVKLKDIEANTEKLLQELKTLHLETVARSKVREILLDKAFLDMTHDSSTECMRLIQDGKRKPIVALGPVIEYLMHLSGSRLVFEGNDLEIARRHMLNADRSDLNTKNKYRLARLEAFDIDSKSVAKEFNGDLLRKYRRMAPPTKKILSSLPNGLICGGDNPLTRVAIALLLVDSMAIFEEAAKSDNRLFFFDPLKHIDRINYCDSNWKVTKVIEGSNIRSEHGIFNELSKAFSSFWTANEGSKKRS